MLYTYSFADRTRDLSGVMSTVIKDEPRFISNFKPVADATSRKHEFWEDQLTGRAISAPTINDGILTVSPEDAAKLQPGTMIALHNDPALFRVDEIDGETVHISLAASNGSEYTAVSVLPDYGTFIIVSTPMAEGSTNGDGEENYQFGSTVWNATQIFRKEIVISGSALAVSLYGNADNQLNRQTAFAMSELARDLNRVALFGRRVEAAAGVRGEAGGLYYFANLNRVPVINAQGTTLDSFIINDAAQNVLGEGGDPMQILCSPGQARVISREFSDRMQLLRSDDRRGAYVAVIVNEINGKGMTILADPDMPDNDVWVLDPACFGLANLAGRAITDTDATPKGFDGIRRLAIGELTFEFKNIQQRACRISGLKSSSDAIRELRG